MTGVFLDTAPLIYLVEGSEPVRERVRDRMATWIEEGVPFHTSVLTLSELLVPAKRVGDDARVRQYKSALRELLSGPLRSIGEDEAEHAAEIRARYGFRTPDALQLAAALACGCDRFYTNDRALSRFDALAVVLALS